MAAAIRNDVDHLSDQQQPSLTPATTPLHRAAERGELAEVERLLSAGEDANARDKDGKSPLHGAKSDDIARLLIRFGADPSAENAAGYTPLHSAVRNGRAEVVAVLLEHHAGVNARPRGYRLTPLHLAVDDNRIELAQTLLDHGADVNAVDGVGMTPLAMAAERGYHELVKVLIRRGGELGPQLFE